MPLGPADVAGARLRALHHGVASLPTIVADVEVNIPLRCVLSINHH